LAQAVEGRHQFRHWTEHETLRRARFKGTSADARLAWKAYIPIMESSKIDMRPFKAGKTSGVDKLVLATVNASYRRDISAATLSECLASAGFGNWLTHVAAFFTDVDAHLVFRFAASHGIGKSDLAKAYFAMSAQSGERNPALEAELVPVGTAAR
jgi:hypothetical protein